ncbi:ectopic p granules protein [Anaeramoeba ignava]|uniref:Ectopic p granules protein n=1 Tax=Anaeramoeba ignava TaxID=1746090 RepID=A0A9Q0LHF6_ANAIG|nr:ectopic p granules protein [Anaeramoeba ignava]
MNFTLSPNSNHFIQKYIPDYKSLLTPKRDQLFSLISTFYSSNITYLKSLSNFKSLKKQIEEQESNLWRIENQTKIQKKTCHSNEIITTMGFVIATFDDELVEKLKSNYSQLSSNLMSEIPDLFSKLRISEAKVSLFFQKFLNSKSLKTLKEKEKLKSKAIQKTKIYLNTLFFYERIAKENADLGLNKFSNSIQKWIRILVNRLFELETKNNSLFVFFHLLTTPGSSKWAYDLVNFDIDFNNPSIEYFEDLLGFVLFPVVKLKNEPNKNYIKENDFLLYFQKLLIQKLFLFLFAFPGELGFDSVWKISDELAKILSSAIKEYDDYINMQKKITKTLSEIICLVEEYSQKTRTKEAKEKFPKLIDKIFLDCIKTVSNCNNKIIFGNLLDLPFYSISTSSAFQILKLVVTGNEEDSPMFSQQWIKVFQKGNDIFSNFCHMLNTSNDSKNVLLFLANLAIFQNSEDFVLCIADTIFKVGCTDTECNEKMFEHAKIALGKICVKFPHFISFIFSLTSQSIVDLESQVVELYEEFPIHKWRLLDADVRQITVWLNFPPNTILFQFACWLVNEITWGYSEKISQFEVLNQIEVQMKIVEFILNLYYKSPGNIDVRDWCWRSLFKMHPYSDLGERKMELLSFPDDSRLNLTQYLDQDKKLPNEPIIAFVALVFCDVKDDSEMKKLFQILINENKLYSASLVLRIKIPQILSSILKTKKLNWNYEERIAKTDELIKPFLRLDSFNISEEDVEKKSKNSNLLGSIIDSLITVRKETKEHNFVSIEEMIRFWFSYFTSIPKWNKDKMIVSHLNELFKVSIISGQHAFISYLVDWKYLELMKKKMWLKNPNEKKKGIFRKKAKRITLAKMKKNIPKKERFETMNKNSWFYFEVLLVELLFQMKTIIKLGYKIVKFKGVPLKKILKKNKIETNFEIINSWIEFAQEINTNNLIFPLVMQVLFSFYFLIWFKKEITIEMVDDSLWFGKYLFEFTNKSVTEVQKMIVDILKKKIKEIETQKNSNLKNGDTEDPQIYQTMIKWIIAPSLAELKQKSIQNQNLLFLSLFESNILNPSKNNYKVNIPNAENFAQLHQSLWFQNVSIEKVRKRIEINKKLTEDLAGYLYIFINKSMQPEKEFVNVDLKPTKYNNISNRNRSQKIQKNAKNLDSSPLFSLYQIYKLNGKNFSQIESNFKQKYPLLKKRANDLRSLHDEFDSCNKDYLTACQNLYSNIPVIEIIEKVCEYQKEIVEPNSKNNATTTVKMSHILKFTFTYSKVEKNSFAENFLQTNRKQISSFLDPEKISNDTFTQQDLLVIIYGLDFAEQCSALAKRQKKRTLKNPVKNIDSIATNWFFEILTKSFTDPKCLSYPAIQVFIKDFCLVLGFRFIKNEVKFIDQIFNALTKNTQQTFALSKLFNPQIVPTRMLEFYSKILDFYVENKEETSFHVLSCFRFNEWLKTNPDPKEIEKAEKMFLSHSNKSTYDSFPKLAVFNSQALSFILVHDFESRFLPLLDQFLELFAQNQTICELWDIFAQLPFSDLKLDALENTVSLISEKMQNLLREINPKKEFYESIDQKVFFAFLRFLDSLTNSFCKNQQITNLKQEAHQKASSLAFKLYLPLLGFSLDSVKNTYLYQESFKIVDESFFSFCRGISLLETHLPGTLLCFLGFFSNTLSKTSNQDLINKFTLHFGCGLFWEKFHPTLQTMIQILQFSETNFGDLFGMIFAKIQWDIVEKEIVDPQKNDSLNFYELLFEMAVNFIRGFKRFADENYSQALLKCISNISSLIHWENLPSKIYKPTLELLQFQNKIMEWDYSIQLKESFDYQPNQFPKQISNFEEKNLALITFLEKIALFNSEKNLENVVPFLEFAKYLLKLSSEMIPKEKIPKEIVSSSINELTTPLSENNFISLIKELIRISLVNDQEARSNLSYLFELYSVENSKFREVLLKAFANHLLEHPTDSSLILSQGCKKIEDMNQFIPFSESCHEAFLISKEMYSNFHENFKPIDFHLQTFQEKCVEAKGILTFCSCITNHLKLWENAFTVERSLGYLEQILLVLVKSNWTIKESVKIYYLLDLWVRGFNKVYFSLKKEENLQELMGENVKSFIEKLSILTKKEKNHNQNNSDENQQQINQLIISLKLLKLIFELVFSPITKKKKTKEKIQKDFSKILNSKENEIYKRKIEKFRKFFHQNVQQETPPSVIIKMTRFLLSEFLFADDYYSLSIFDNFRDASEWKLRK